MGIDTLSFCLLFSDHCPMTSTSYTEPELRRLNDTVCRIQHPRVQRRGEKDG